MVRESSLVKGLVVVVVVVVVVVLVVRRPYAASI